MSAAIPGVDLTGFLTRSDGRAEINFLVRGARCAGCLGKIERGVAALPGVETARMNLTSGRLHVAWRDIAGDPAEVRETLQALGYACTPFDPEDGRRQTDREGRGLALALGVAGFGVGNVMMFSVPVWAGLFGQELGDHARQTLYWLSALVATPCALFAGQTFFLSAYKALRRGRANMDVPITLGVLLTLAVSFLETIRGRPHAYFDAAVTLVFLLLIGRFLDHRLRASARSAAKDLLSLQAPIAQVVGPDGVVRGQPVGQVQVGDRISVRAGERVPVDGCVVEGAADVRLSLITGESRPAYLDVGAPLPAGALVLDGRLVIECRARAEDSTLADLARLIDVGAQSKSRYVRLADRAASLYVPVVHSAAALTFIGSAIVLGSMEEALMRAAAVLIVTCPCALGLAVPAVQIAASSWLFRRGVLVKSGAALERLADADAVIFDKTGVLTEPARLLFDDEADLAAAAPLARASRHPLARMLAAAAGPGPVAADVVETAGAGVEGRVEGRVAKLGSAAFLGHSPGLDASGELWFAADGAPPRRFRIEERIRPGAAEAVAALKALGLSVEILSGDRAGAVTAAAERLNLPGRRAETTPAAKAEVVRLREGEGAKILMVGDGLNDAAAMSLAHVSMAPGEACEASQNAADLVFTGEDLRAVPQAVACARRARARALENFSLAAIYNGVAIPAAMIGLVNPLVAAVAMSASSLIVILNASRMAGGGEARP